MSRRSTPSDLIRGWGPVRRQGHAPTQESTALCADAFAAGGGAARAANLSTLVRRQPLALDDLGPFDVLLFDIRPELLRCRTRDFISQARQLLAGLGLLENFRDG